MKTRLFLLFILSLVLFSCHENKFKRAFFLSKTDDDNWTTSAMIECDSVDMQSANYAIYWIDSKKYNLYAHGWIKIATNPDYNKNTK